MNESRYSLCKSNYVNNPLKKRGVCIPFERSMNDASPQMPLKQECTYIFKYTSVFQQIMVITTEYTRVSSTFIELYLCSIQAKHLM